MDEPLCRNASEIGNYLGVSGKQIPYLIKMYELPVFRIEGKGKYKALKTSLYKWLQTMEKEFLVKY